MRKITPYIIPAAMLLLAGACTKVNTDIDAGDHGYMTFAPSLGTKTVLSPSDLSKVEFTLYGLKEVSGSTTPVAVIDGKTLKADATEATSVTWKIGSANDKFEWESGVNYTFYAWTATNNATNPATTAASFFGNNGLSYSDSKLTISAKEMPVDDSGFDFCWSDIVKRTATSSDYSTVSLNFSHLFTAFSLSAHNYTSQPIVIKNVTLKGVQLKKSAEIDFSGDETDVTYTTPGTGSMVSSAELISGGNISLPAGSSKENIVKGASDKRKYILMWPQTKAELAVNGYTNSTTAPTSGAYIKVVYTQNGGSDLTAYVQIPQDDTTDDTDWAWPAGVRQNMELSFSDKSLSLKVSPYPWNQTEPEYDYGGAVQVESNSFKFASTSKHINPTGTKDVYFQPGYPIILQFKITTPKNASWLVEKIGDFDAFEIDNVTAGSDGISGDGIDTKEGVIDGNVAYIAIYPKITNPQKDYKIKLSFSVRGNNGVVTPINDLLQGSDDQKDWYTFYILK